MTESELAAQVRLAVGRLYRQIRQNVVGALNESQLSTLVTVELEGPIRLGELAAIEGVTPSTLSRVVATLEESKLVRRERDRTDKRASWLTITARGRSTIESVRTERTLWLTRRVAELSNRQRVALLNALDAMEALARNDNG
jgi:DNA-binding MarR family transcriptional regulator